MAKKTSSSRRKFLFSLTALTLGGLMYGYRSVFNQDPVAKVVDRPIPNPEAKLGINISGIEYWGSEYPFVDLMHQSSEWSSQAPSGEWGKGPKLSLDKNGWVSKLAPNTKARKILCSGGKNEYPSGRYIILYDGEGEIKPNQLTANVIRHENGRLEVDIDGKQGMFAVEIISTNPQNYIRNIRVIMPGYESKYTEDPWHPDFLSRWSGVTCIRLMDMMRTNNSNQITWQDRPQLNDASYVKKGVPVELLVDLANRLKTDVWFCMPHQADDVYIKSIATIVKNTLSPNLKAWIEYSNEVWNRGFLQYTYAKQRGVSLKLTNEDWLAPYKFYAHRSVQIFQQWEQVFSGKERLVCVLATQNSFLDVAKHILGYETPDESIAANYADVLAIAPYFGFSISTKENEHGVSAADVSDWNLDKLFDYFDQYAFPETQEKIASNLKVAKQFKLNLVAYEAGQHLVGYDGAENNEKLTKLLMRANADKRMGALYTKYLDYWTNVGGDLICMYNSVGPWSRWGSWGLLQHTKNNGKDSPKFKAVIEWAKSRGQLMTYLEKRK